MKLLQWMTAVAALAFFVPAQAQWEGAAKPNVSLGPEAVGGAETILYRYTGVTNSVPQLFGTVWHCTNFSGVAETIRIVVRAPNGTLLANRAANVDHLSTVSFVTKLMASVNVGAGSVGDLGIGATPVGHGSAAIAATTTSVVCTAMILDARAGDNQLNWYSGVALHAVRFAPIPGTQE